MSYLDSRTTGNGDAELVTTAPVPRTTRRTALRPAGSREELRADAREEARLARGRDLFIWRERMLPVGVPLGAAVGWIVWGRRRSGRDAMTTALLVTSLAYLGAHVEWRLRRAAHRRRRASDFVRDD